MQCFILYKYIQKASFFIFFKCIFNRGYILCVMCYIIYNNDDFELLFFYCWKWKKQRKKNKNAIFSVFVLYVLKIIFIQIQNDTLWSLFEIELIKYFDTSHKIYIVACESHIPHICILLFEITKKKKKKWWIWITLYIFLYYVSHKINQSVTTVGFNQKKKCIQYNFDLYLSLPT